MREGSQTPGDSTGSASYEDGADSVCKDPLHCWEVTTSLQEIQQRESCGALIPWLKKDVFYPFWEVFAVLKRPEFTGQQRGAVYLLLRLPRAYWLFVQVLIAPFIKRAISPSKLGGIQHWKNPAQVPVYFSIKHLYCSSRMALPNESSINPKPGNRQNAKKRLFNMEKYPAVSQSSSGDHPLPLRNAE